LIVLFGVGAAASSALADEISQSAVTLNSAQTTAIQE
jgi:hypothetical protein